MFHLGWFMGSGFSVQTWALDPWAGNTGHDWMKGDLFVNLAASLERARFDYLLVEDTSMVEDAYGRSMETTLKYGLLAPKSDPVPLIPLLTQRTKHIGIAVTLSTSFYHPFMAARRVHLAWFLGHGFGVNDWRSPWHGAGGNDWMRPGFHQDFARSLERACFDYLIISGSSFVCDAYGQSSEIYLTNAMTVPKHDPAVLASVMLLATQSSCGRRGSQTPSRPISPRGSSPSTPRSIRSNSAASTSSPAAR
jgi:hypothetical protein